MTVDRRKNGKLDTWSGKGENDNLKVKERLVKEFIDTCVRACAFGCNAVSLVATYCFNGKVKPIYKCLARKCKSCCNARLASITCFLKV